MVLYLIIRGTKIGLIYPDPASAEAFAMQKWEVAVLLKAFKHSQDHLKFFLTAAKELLSKDFEGELRPEAMLN